MPPPPPKKTDDELQYNLPIYGTLGEFSLSASVCVPYFMALLDLKRLTSEVKTHEEVSPSMDTVYSLVELFQRNIDEDRVQREIVDGYLKLPSKLKFFNSLTVVLLPKAKTGEIESEFTDYSNNDPKIPYEAGQEFDQWFTSDGCKKSVFGGVQFVSTETLSRLRWDLNRVDAVAVDGQHRLRALKLWIQERNNHLSDIEKTTRIPVIFLLLHESTGFKRAISSASGIKPIAREIFTDLNKNAREVDLSTEIILDDRSIESCCVRSLVTSTTCTESETLLPLSSVRWRDANNRFDQSYYVNSLVNLYILVRDLLDLEVPTNPMDVSECKSFIKKVNTLLGSGSPSQVVVDGISLTEYYEKQFIDPEEKDNAVAPLGGIPSQYLAPAVKGFQERFSGWLIKILKDFRPYKNVLEYTKKHNLITGEFSQYLSQPEAHKESLKKILEDKHGDRWQELVIGQHVEAIQRIKGHGENLGEQWPFKTIFQKALVRFGKVIFIDAPEDRKELYGNIDEFLGFFDKLYENDVFRVQAPLVGEAYTLWTFIALNYGSGKIRVASTSEARIKALLTLWYFAWRYAKHVKKEIVSACPQGADDKISLTEILTYFAKKGTQPEWPVNDSYTELFNLFEDNAHIMLGKETKVDVPENKRREVARERLRKIFEVGLSPWMKCPPDPSANDHSYNLLKI